MIPKYRMEISLEEMDFLDDRREDANSLQAEQTVSLADYSKVIGNGERPG